MAWTERIDPADDRLHPDDGSLYWNETTLLSWRIPERDLCGFIYYYLRPNVGLAVGGPAVWDRSGEDVYTCRYWGWDQHLTIPEGAEMYDLRLANTLEARTLELQRAYRFTYDAGGFALDLTWEALCPPHYMPGKDDGGVNEAIEGWVAGAAEHVTMGHYEHNGWMRGTVTLDGEVLEVDCSSLRDRGWGPRSVDGVQFDPRKRGAWPHAIASADSAFQLYAISRLAENEDPVEGTEEPVATGYYIRDGVKGLLVSGTRRVERDAAGLPVREHIDAVDDLGRELHAVGEVRNRLRFLLNSDFIDFWCLVEWDYDGQQVFGETQDFMLFRHWRRYQQRLRAHEQIGAIG